MLPGEKTSAGTLFTWTGAWMHVWLDKEVRHILPAQRRKQAQLLHARRLLGITRVAPLCAARAVQLQHQLQPPPLLPLLPLTRRSV